MVCLGLLQASGQSTSNKGTEFWTCWMAHVDGTGSAMSLYITGDITTTGTVSFSDGTTAIPFNVTANKVTIVNIPTSVYLSAAGQATKGIHITSAKNIVVYAHIYHNARSGATLVLPVNAMGKDYYSINYTQKPTSAYSVFCIIATENNTTVEITPSATLTTGQAAKTAFTVTLKKGEVYQGMSSTDLTGTHIKSISSGTQTCKKIAVYSGSTWLAINCNTGQGAKTSADNLFQQVYPTAAWGKNYVTAPLAGRNYDVFRIVYSDPTAKVTLNGTLIQAAQLTNSLYYEYSSQSANVITSDKPIQVAQYAVTQNATINCVDNPAETIGDPEMIFLSPIEQGLDHVTLYSTDQQAIVQSYINVIIPTSAVASFTVDGASYTTFKTINSSYSYAQIPVKSGPSLGTHNIAASQPFNAIAYGFGQFESYGYAAGTDLKNLNEFIELQDKSTQALVSQGCAGSVYTPQLSIPYQTQKITWDFKDNSTPVVVNNPVVVKQTTKGDQVLYNYQSPKTVTYTTPGSYSIVATVLNPTADDCGSNEDVEFDYTISEIPVAKFTSSVGINGACPGDEIKFTDGTDPGAIGIKSRSWDFGDANATAANPNNVTNQNPKHIYTQPGDYTATLTVENNNGCATGLQQTIHVNKAPAAAFKFSDSDCETRDITFTDQSVANEGTLSTWLWDFGDGTTTVTQTTAQPFTHRFAAAGTYHVSLTVTSSKGCSSTVINDIVIYPLPVVDFTLPDVCLSDAFAQFTSKTTIADNSETQFTYSWNFGDAARATLLNTNTSTLANPKHKYTQVGTYTVSLTVTSKNGCAVTKTQQFTVNGDTPNAAFTVNNLGNTYCSGSDVLFKDNSTVNFGSITKLVWYFDYNNNLSLTVVYTKDQFPANGIFAHNYGLFGTPASKNYAVKMEAYSGASCVSVSGITNITVYANPVVNVTAIGTLCQETSPVQIKAGVQNGVLGTGIFSGKGVSASGLFDPAKSGPGTFTVDYQFTTAATGCTYTYSQQVAVYPTPTANAGADVHVLQGGSVPLNASADGNKPLTYKWTLLNGSKAIGLDKDDVLNPNASPVDDVTYMLTVTSADGCAKSSTVNVMVLKAPEVPNTFTPNGDGVNDRWEIKYLDTYPNCTVEVYNRLGEKLYSSVGYPLPWDGTFRGAALPVGTYYYIINPKNGRKAITGSITIIR